MATLTNQFFNIDEIKNRVIFGIKLQDQDGNEFSDDLLQSYLNSAISWAEHKLNICILPRQLNEEHDYFLNDYMNWGFLKTWKKPILSVDNLSMWYGTEKMFDVPSEWLKIDALSGQVQMFPNQGSAGGMIITATGGLITPLITGNIGFAPKLWRITYTAGMTTPDDPNAGTPNAAATTDQTSASQFSAGMNSFNYGLTDIHPDLVEMIYKKASIGILGVWGDLIIGAGIASEDIGVDDLHQSIDTTQSAMFSGAAARIKQLQEDIDSYLPELRSYYGGIDMTVI